MIYFTSDPHFGHENIILYENREFENVDDMDYYIVERINQQINKSDVLFFLGDISFHGREKTAKILSHIKCTKHLITGNHDRGHSNSWWNYVGFKSVYNYPILFDNKFMISHEPIKDTKYPNVHGHLHSYKHRESDLRDYMYYNVCLDATKYNLVSIDEILGRFWFIDMDN